MSGLENEEEKQGAKKAPWKPQAASKAEKLAAKSAGKYEQYEKRRDKKEGARPVPSQVFKKKTLEPMFSKREQEQEQPNFKRKEKPEPLFAKRDAKSEPSESKQSIAHELTHVVQQGKGKPASKVEYLKHPDSKATPAAKSKLEKSGKKVIVADRKRNVSAPADSDTLAAIAEKLFEKLNAEAEFERDVTGAD